MDNIEVTVCNNSQPAIKRRRTDSDEAKSSEIIMDTKMPIVNSGTSDLTADIYQYVNPSFGTYNRSEYNESVCQFMDMLISHKTNGLTAANIRSKDRHVYFQQAMTNNVKQKELLALKIRLLEAEIQKYQHELSNAESHIEIFENFQQFAKGCPLFLGRKQGLWKEQAINERMLGHDVAVFKIPGVIVAASIWAASKRTGLTDVTNQHFVEARNQCDYDYLVNLHVHCDENDVMCPAYIFDLHDNITFEHTGHRKESTEFEVTGSLYILCDLEALAKYIAKRKGTTFTCQLDRTVQHPCDATFRESSDKKCNCKKYERWAMLWLTHEWILARRDLRIDAYGNVSEQKSSA